jgi:hypothetical protein
MMRGPHCCGQVTYQNELLRKLNENALEGLRPTVEFVRLKRRQALLHRGLPIEHIYSGENG